MSVYECKFCDFNTVRKNIYKKHMNSENHKNLLKNYSVLRNQMNNPAKDIHNIPKFTCLSCNYNFKRKSNYKRHLLKCKSINGNENIYIDENITNNIKEQHDNKKYNTEEQDEYKCEICNYVCNYKQNYTKHLMTKKHVKNENENEIKKNNNNKSEIYSCSICDFETTKKYNYEVHLNCKKHIKKMEELQKEEPPKINTDNIETFKNEVITTLMTQLSSVLEENNKSILAEQTKQMVETQTKLFHEMAVNQTVTNNTINNNNNNTNNHQFNMNMFLNETCKDAMNMSEFMENLTVTMEDMEMTGTLGFAKGMSRIIMNNLNALEVHKRPIHCSDAKRETMYVKNNGVWEKDTDDKKHTKELIYKVSSLNLKHLLKWRDLPRNKGYDNPEHKKNDEFTILVMEINKVKVEEIEKVVTIISKQVTIDKNKVRMSGYLN